MTWIISVVGVILLSVLTDVLLPEGQMNKYVKGIFSILLIFVIIAPLADFIRKDIEIGDLLNFDMESDGIVVEKSEIVEMEESLRADLETLGIQCEKVVIFSRENNINTIVGVNVFLKEKKEEMDVDMIRKIITNKINIEQEKIFIYGI